jgi:DNA-binding response OmpR family regulator
MRGKRFLSIIKDPEKQAKIKELCCSIGFGVLCVNNPKEAKIYLPFLTEYHCIIIYIGSLNQDAMDLCKQIKEISPNTIIAGLRSPGNEEENLLDALLFKSTQKIMLSNSRANKK